MSTPTIRLWNPDWTLAHTLAPGDILEAKAGRIVFSAAHPVAQWIASLERTVLYATIDEDGERWSGALCEWTLSRPGQCPECEHCNSAQLETTWREDWVPPPANAVVYPNPFTDTN